LRINRLPKRLCEALVGVAVQRTVPDAKLWAPTFHQRNGFGPPEPDSLSSLVLQCSPAEMRNAGPSTRVSRAQLAAYRDELTLAPWSGQVRFVLAGLGPGQVPSLYVVSLHDLAHVVDRQKRGTINNETLTELMGTPSRYGYGATARPLEEELIGWIAGQPSADVAVTLPQTDPDANWINKRSYPWFVRPSPIAVSFSVPAAAF
jgi:hypothetical protein